MTRRLDAPTRPAADPGDPPDLDPADDATVPAITPAPTTFYPVPLGAGVEQVVFDLVSFDPSGHGTQLLVADEEALAWERDVFANDGDHDAYIATLDARAVLGTADDLEDDPADDPVLVAASDRLIEEVFRARRDQLGRVARAHYHDRLVAALRWSRRRYQPERGPFEVFAGAVLRLVWRRFVAFYSWEGLGAERRDEAWRHRALRDRQVLGEYLTAVRTETARWLAWRSRKPRETVIEGDVVAEIVARALEAFNHRSWASYERAGRAAIWQIRDQVIGEFRRRKQLWLVDAPLDWLHRPSPRPDQLLARRELEARWPESDSLTDRLRPRLTRRQQQYLDAIQIELQLGDVFGLVTRVAARMGRDKAQVSRVLERIRRVAVELDAAELFELE
jgi:hypothetical protein